MINSIVNRTETPGDEEVYAAIRAINNQIAYEFESYWSSGAGLPYEGTTDVTPETDFARRDLGWNAIQISRPDLILSAFFPRESRSK